MKTPSPQEADKTDWADREAKRIDRRMTDCISGKPGHQLCGLDSEIPFIKNVLLEADKNGYERGRREASAAFIVPASSNVECSKLNVMPGKIEFVPRDDEALLRECSAAFEAITNIMLHHFKGEDPSMGLYRAAWLRSYKKANEMFTKLQSRLAPSVSESEGKP